MTKNLAEMIRTHIKSQAEGVANLHGLEVDSVSARYGSSDIKVTIVIRPKLEVIEKSYPGMDTLMWGGARRGSRAKYGINKLTVLEARRKKYVVVHDNEPGKHWLISFSALTPLTEAEDKE